MNKKKFKVDLLIYGLFFISSQIFYLHILGTQGLIALASYLDPNNHGPHIHEQFKLPFQIANAPELPFRSAFDVAVQAFHWPNQLLGVLTGIGVLITGLVLGFVDRIVLFLVLLLSFLALLISPIVFVGLVLYGISNGTQLKTGSNKRIPILVISFSLTVLLALFIYEYADTPHGWRGSLFIAASWLFRDLSFYLNTVFYVGIAIISDFYGLKKIISFLGFKQSSNQSEY